MQSNDAQPADTGDIARISPEPQLGNVEYKWKLVCPSEHRLEHLVSQLKWRLQEGDGVAVYRLGVRDCGRVTGVTQRELGESLRCLGTMAERLGACTRVTCLNRMGAANHPRGVRYSADVLVRQMARQSQDLIKEARIAVVGGVETGKSTLIGVLTHDQLDNGHGLSRLNMLRHLHEIRSGHTSSVCQEIFGFDAQGRSVNYKTCATLEDIYARASYLTTFIDLAGSRKYLRTTMYGLMAYKPHAVMLVVSAVLGPAGAVTQELLDIINGLQIPYFVVISKRDLVSAECLQRTRRDIEQLLSTQPPGSGGAVSVLEVSSVTGEGLNALTQHLYTLVCDITVESGDVTAATDVGCEFHVNEVYLSISGSPVVAGFLANGSISENSTLYLGPDTDGVFTRTQVVSIHRNRRAQQTVHRPCTAALALSHTSSASLRLRKGLVLLHQPASVCCELEAHMRHLSAVRVDWRVPMLLIVNCVCQTVSAVQAGGLPSPHTAEVHVRLRFVRHPECVREGQRLLFRQTRSGAYGVGVVTHTHALTDTQ